MKTGWWRNRVVSSKIEFKANIQLEEFLLLRNAIAKIVKISAILSKIDNKYQNIFKGDRLKLNL